MMNSTSRNCSSPFTATQWQELEHQALIFKYMVSGVPIPPDLIFSLKRSFDSTISSKLFPHHPVGWGCFEMGYSRKTDPEPGRCRRTDGKKWRCSKEAYPDSKYCERHMHRGRNRSRKPVEISSTTKPTISPLNLSSSSISSSSSLSSETQSYHQNPYPFPYPHSSSSSLSKHDFSSNNTHPTLFLYSGSHSPHSDKDYRQMDGPREGAGEQAFFPSVADSTRNIPQVFHQQPIPIDPYKGFSQSLSQCQFYNPNQQQHQQEQHCFVLGTDFNKSSTIKTENEVEKEETQKPLLHFFEDCPPKNSDSWLDLASHSNIQDG